MIEQVRKTSIRLSTLATITDPAERKKRIETVEAEFRTLNSDPDIAQRFKAALGRLKGGIEIAQNKVADGVATLDTAIKQMNPDSSSPIDQDLRADALMEYAQAQLRLNQTAPARQALQDLISRRPENLTARALLTDIYITERNADAATRELGVLERVAGDAEIVKRMRVRLEAIQGKLDDNLVKMPESTRAEQFLKLQAAATLVNDQEVLRLAKLMLQANPADPDGVTAAAQSLVALGKRDEAVEVVNAALKAKPDDARFQNIAASLAAQTPEQREQLTRDNIEKITDPYAKAMATGALARQQGRPADAIQSFKAAQKLKPEDPRAYDAQFQVAILATRFSDAEAVLSDLARTNADQAEGALRRVQLAGAKAAVEPDADRRASLYKDAVAQGQALAQQRGELAAASLLYAQLLAQSGDLANAIDQYSQTLDKSPTNIDAMLGIAACLLRTDRRAEAADRVKAVQRSYPDDPRTVDLTLDYDLRFGDPAKAVDTLAARVDKSPSDAALAGRLGVALEQVATNKGETDGKPFLERAAEVYSKAWGRFPQDLRFLSAYAEAQRKLGNAAVGEQAIEKAVNDPANANRPELPQLLADAYVRSNKIDDAVRVLVNVVNATKPAPTEAVIKLSSILAKQNKMADALTVLDLRKDDANVARQKAQVLMDAGDGKAATEAVESLIASFPSADSYVVAAFVSLRTNEWDKAEGFANKVLTERPTDVAALYYRGQARTNKTPADLDGAVADLTKARDVAPSSPDIRVALADAYRKRGDRDAMLNELQTAWNNDKNSRVILMRLVEAYSNTTPPSWNAVDRIFDEAKKSPKLANDFDVLITHAESYTFRNDTPRAVAEARAALATVPNDPRVQQRYLELLIKAKAWRDIIADTAQVQGEKPEDFWVWRARGVAYYNLDQKADAAKALDTAFKLATSTTNPNMIATAARAVADTLGAADAAQRLDAFNDISLRLMTAELVRDSGDIAGRSSGPKKS
ncbi:MAG: tetratricopeptide repeat protein [Tepidisphaeraceae bacterium]